MREAAASSLCSSLQASERARIAWVPSRRGPRAGGLGFEPPAPEQVLEGPVCADDSEGTQGCSCLFLVDSASQHHETSVGFLLFSRQPVTKNTFRQYRVLGKGGFGEVSEHAHLQWEVPLLLSLFLSLLDGLKVSCAPWRGGKVRRGPGNRRCCRGGKGGWPQGPWDGSALGASLRVGIGGRSGRSWMSLDGGVRA